MSSSPPSARDTPPPVLARLAERTFRASAVDDPIIFFCVEGAPREACRTRTDGCLTFETELAGELFVSDTSGELRIDLGGHQATVRYLLPSAVDLALLDGQRVEVRVVQRYLGPGRATIDAELWDSSGRLVLWAHDGRMPIDRSAHGLALRQSVDADGAHRLAVAHSGGLTSLGAPDLAPVWVGSDPYAMAVVRAGADDVSFVLLRR